MDTTSISIDGPLSLVRIHILITAEINPIHTTLIRKLPALLLLVDLNLSRLILVKGREIDINTQNGQLNCLSCANMNEF